MFVINKSSFYMRVRCRVVNQNFFFFKNFFFNFTAHPPCSAQPCCSTGALRAEPNLNNNRAIHLPLM